MLLPSCGLQMEKIMWALIFEVKKVLESRIDGHPAGQGKGSFSHPSPRLSLAIDCSCSRGLCPASVEVQPGQCHVGLRAGELVNRCHQTGRLSCFHRLSELSPGIFSGQSILRAS